MIGPLRQTGLINNAAAACLVSLGIGLLALFTSAPLPAAEPATNPTKATVPSTQPVVTAASVRALSTVQASLRATVRVRGTITYVCNVPSMLFLQDATGGVCVMGPRDPLVRRQLRPGAQIEVEGITSPGHSVSYITNRGKEPLNITVLDGLSVLPPRPVTFSELASVENQGDLVEVQGIVRAVRTETLGAANQPEALVVTLAAGPARLDVAYLVWTGAQSPPLAVGSLVRVRGVFNTAAADKQQVAMSKLLVYAVRDLQTQMPATVPANLPVSPVGEVEVAADPATPARLRVQGVVTVSVPGKGFYLEDAANGVWLDAPAIPAKPGDRLDVTGFTARRNGSAMLEDISTSSLGRSDAPPAPPLINAEQALSGSYNSRLVTTEALVLEVSRLSEGTTLVLQADERVFLARLADAGQSGGSISENSWVRVTGVCVNNRLPDANANGLAARPVSFHLLLPSVASVAVIHAPNWWTLERVLIASTALLLILLAVVVWVLALRRRVAIQTTQIRGHLRQQTLNEERMRIARELHDSLEQDLLGITLQLKATEKLLDRPEKAKDSLQLASAMVRRSQAETHRAVWDLRERKTGQEGLVATLRQALTGLTASAGTGGGPAIEVEVTGAEIELPPQTENHLLRVALESVTNAFKHAAAKTVRVAVAYSADHVSLSVTDDGRGFDADHPPAPVSGHFGLFGMRERAAKLTGQLEIKSKPGEGTQVRLVAPIHTNGDGNGSEARA